jgi:Tol biopolymer transport system component
VDRDLRSYLEIPTSVPSNFSPDGSKVLIQSNLSGIAQLCTVPRDSDEVVVCTSTDGNERTQLYVIGDNGEGLRPLAEDPEHIHRAGGVTRDGQWLAYASNAADGVDFDVYLVLVSGGEAARRLFAPGGWCRRGGSRPTVAGWRYHG